MIALMMFLLVLGASVLTTISWSVRKHEDVFFELLFRCAYYGIGYSILGSLASMLLDSPTGILFSFLGGIGVPMLFMVMSRFDDHLVDMTRIRDDD